MQREAFAFLYGSPVLRAESLPLALVLICGYLSGLGRGRFQRCQRLWSLRSFSSIPRNRLLHHELPPHCPRRAPRASHHRCPATPAQGLRRRRVRQAQALALSPVPGAHPGRAVRSMADVCLPVAAAPARQVGVAAEANEVNTQSLFKSQDVYVSHAPPRAPQTVLMAA